MASSSSPSTTTTNTTAGTEPNSSQSCDSLDNTRVKFVEKDSEDKDIGEGEILDIATGPTNGILANRGDASSENGSLGGSMGSLEGIRGSSLHGDTDSEEEMVDDGTYARIIVIGVDGSAEAYHSFHWYISNMHVDGNFVILVHAFELPLLHSFQEMYVSPQMWSSTLRREARATTNMEKRLRGVLARCRIPGRFIARGGRPGEVLVKVAEEEDADLIVVGTKGHSKIHRVILGSVSNYVTKNAPCSVTVCRHKGRGRHASGGSMILPSSSGRRRTMSASSTGSRVKFSLSGSDEKHPRAMSAKEQTRRNSATTTGTGSEKTGKGFFRGLISSRKRNQSTSAAMETQALSHKDTKGSTQETKRDSMKEKTKEVKKETTKDTTGESSRKTKEEGQKKNTEGSNQPLIAASSSKNEDK